MPVGFKMSTKNDLLLEYTHSMKAEQASSIHNKHEVVHNRFQKQLCILTLPFHISLPSEVELSESWEVMSDIQDDVDDIEENNFNILQHIPPKYVRRTGGLVKGYAILKCVTSKLVSSGQDNLSTVFPNGVTFIQRVDKTKVYSEDGSVKDIINGEYAESGDDDGDDIDFNDERLKGERDGHIAWKKGDLALIKLSYTVQLAPGVEVCRNICIHDFINIIK